MAVQVDPSPAQILEKEMSASKAGMKDAVKKIGCDVSDLVSPVNWTRAHPIGTLCVAAVSGFIAAAYTPSPVHAKKKPAKNGRKRESFADMFKRFTPSHDEPEEKKHEPENTANAPANGGWLTTIIHEVAAIIRPMLVSLVSNSISAYSQQRDAEKHPQDATPPTT